MVNERSRRGQTKGQEKVKESSRKGKGKNLWGFNTKFCHYTGIFQDCIQKQAISLNTT